MRLKDGNNKGGNHNDKDRKINGKRNREEDGRKRHCKSYSFHFES